MTNQQIPLKGKLIAFFHQSSDMYGSDKILLYLAEGVEKSGAKAVVLLPDVGPLTQEFELRGIEYHTLPMLKLTRARFSPKGLYSLICEIKPALVAYDQVFGSRKVDIVHTNTLAVLGGAIWARRRQIPHLWHVHEIIEQPWVAANLFPLILRLLADHIVCNSYATFEWLTRTQPRLRKKMSMIWNGVHAPTQLNQEVVKELICRFRPNGTRLAIGLIGRINWWKGQGLLLDAAERLHKKGLRNFSVIFMGSAPPNQDEYKDQLMQRIAQSPMRDSIILEGYTKEIWSAYAALDIVCVPSTEPEPFGLVAVEAMAVGKPVVASRAGGLTEIVQDGVTGLTFTLRDAEALAIALEKLLTNDLMRNEMGKASKLRFNAEFTVDKMTDRFAEAFMKTVET